MEPWEWQPRDVTSLPGGHGGAETSFQTSRVPPPAIRCQTAPTSRPLLGPEGASQRVTHPRPPGLSTPEKTLGRHSLEGLIRTSPHAPRTAVPPWS